MHGVRLELLWNWESSAERGGKLLWITESSEGDCEAVPGATGPHFRLTFKDFALRAMIWSRSIVWLALQSCFDARPSVVVDLKLSDLPISDPSDRQLQFAHSNVSIIKR